jgi:methylthioribulose-1-phosphate dehydratase
MNMTSPDTDLNDALAAQLANIGRELHRLGWVPATSGNFSARLDAYTCLITASGKHKGKLSALDFLQVDFTGRPVTRGKPSAETLLHTVLYQRFADLGAVLHCHSPNATILTRLLASEHQIVLRDYELLKAFKGITTHQTSLAIPIFENTQDIAALAAQADAYMAAHPDCPAYLIRGHGIYVWGADVEDCSNKLEAMDFLLACELKQLRQPISR